MSSCLSGFPPSTVALCSGAACAHCFRMHPTPLWLSPLYAQFGGLFQQLFATPTDGFEERYRCCSVAMWPRDDKSHYEAGDKIILPSSALDALARRAVELPMLFQIENPATGQRSHCGVMEFIADEGMCYMPHWMMEVLGLPENGIVVIRNRQLPKASFVRLQPMSKVFYDFTDPKALLEKLLRSYSCLTKGDTVRFKYLRNTFDMKVVDLKPADACSIIETDMMVDFAPYGGPEPVGPSGLPLDSAASGGGGSAGPSSRKASDASDAGVGGAGARAGGDASDSKLGDTGAAKEAPGIKLGGATPVGLTPRELRLLRFGSGGAGAGAGAGAGVGAGAGAGAASSGPSTPSLARSASSGASGTPVLSGGGVFCSTEGSSTPRDKPRTQNKFEARRKSTAFSGDGKALNGGGSA